MFGINPFIYALANSEAVYSIGSCTCTRVVCNDVKPHGAPPVAIFEKYIHGYTTFHITLYIYIYTLLPFIHKCGWCTEHHFLQSMTHIVTDFLQFVCDNDMLVLALANANICQC